MNEEKTFSEYRISEVTLTFKDESTHYVLSCVGSLKVEMESKTATKSCGGQVIKKITRGTGCGTATITLHLPYIVYKKMYGMDVSGLVTGVSGYGDASVHKPFTLTGVGEDEDGNEVYLALPNCLSSSAPSNDYENGTEEIKEKELSIDIMPDEYKMGKYEANSGTLVPKITKEKWLREFKPEMIRTASA